MVNMDVLYEKYILKAIYIARRRLRNGYLCEQKESR